MGRPPSVKPVTFVHINHNSYQHDENNNEDAVNDGDEKNGPAEWRILAVGTIFI